MTKIKGFAHLFGRGASLSSVSEDEKEKSKKAKNSQAEQDETEQDVANDEDKDDNDQADDDDSDEADAEDGDKNDGDDEDEDRNVKKGRRAERRRCARIFASQQAAGRVDLSASLAFNSGMSSAAAIRILAATSATAQVTAPRKRSLDERMQAAGNPQPGQDVAASPGASVVNQMTRLYNSAKGKK